MTLQERFNLVPPCLRTADGSAQWRLDDCLLGSISYYIELLFILVGIAAFFYIIYAGIQMATAFGNENKYAAAKSTLLHAILGVIIATLAYTIIAFVTSFFGVDAPKIYNTETGEVIVNDESKITALVAFRVEDDPSGGKLEEKIEVAESGTTGKSFTVGGPNATLYMISQPRGDGKYTQFRAVLTKKSGDEVSLSSERLDDGRYLLWTWGTSKDFQGGTLVVYEKDPATNFEHSKEIKISAP